MNRQTNRVSHDEGKPLRSAHIFRKFMIHRPQTADDMQISAGVDMKHYTVISNISIMDRERVGETFINSFSTLNEGRRARRGVFEPVYQPLLSQESSLGFDGLFLFSAPPAFSQSLSQVSQLSPALFLLSAWASMLQLFSTESLGDTPLPKVSQKSFLGAWVPKVSWFW